MEELSCIRNSSFTTVYTARMKLGHSPVEKERSDIIRFGENVVFCNYRIGVSIDEYVQ